MAKILDKSGFCVYGELEMGIIVLCAIIIAFCSLAYFGNLTIMFSGLTIFNFGDYPLALGIISAIALWLLLQILGDAGLERRPKGSKEAKFAVAPKQQPTIRVMAK